MRWAPTTAVSGFTAAMLLAGGAVTLAQTGGAPGDTVPPAEILKRSQDVYNSLTNYSDVGQSVAITGGTPVAPCTYTIKLARPSLYRIAWDQADQHGIIWSRGTGGFLKMGDSVQKEADLSGALADASGFSQGASVSIPTAFFHVAWGNTLGIPPAEETRLPDDQVGAVACFVLTHAARGSTTTLWIGKADFLIRQVQRVTSAEVVRARFAQAIKQDPKLADSLSVANAQAITSTETHTHIVVNQTPPPAFDH